MKYLWISCGKLGITVTRAEFCRFFEPNFAVFPEVSPEKPRIVLVQPSYCSAPTGHGWTARATKSPALAWGGSPF
jgi:hypothetical protein